MSPKPTQSTETAVPKESAIQKALGAIGFELPTGNNPAPDFELKDLKGKTVKLSDFVGKIVLLNFWATWCGPCKEEMPSVQIFFDAFHNDDIVILAVNLGEKEAIVKNFISENAYTFPILFDSDQKIAAYYGVEAIPTTYVIGTDGKIAARLVSSFNWNANEFLAALSVGE